MWSRPPRPEGHLDIWTPVLFGKMARQSKYSSYSHFSVGSFWQQGKVSKCPSVCMRRPDAEAWAWSRSGLRIRKDIWGIGTSVLLGNMTRHHTSVNRPVPSLSLAGLRTRKDTWDIGTLVLCDEMIPTLNLQSLSCRVILPKRTG